MSKAPLAPASNDAAAYLDRLSDDRRRLMLADLTTAVNARAQLHQLRSLRAGTEPNGRKPRTMKQRIADREQRALVCLRELQVHARVLITDPQEKRETLAMVRRVFVTISHHTAAQQVVHGNPSHRPDDEQFRADCQRAMKRYRVTATEAARVIVRDIAPTLGQKAREDLIRPSIWDEAEQITHLADRLRPKNRTKARR
jgi:hypothetical protein